MMKVIPFTYNDQDDLMANCYVAIDDHLKCLVVDPSCDYDGVINYINKNHLSCQGILLTHTHFDHMRGIDRIAKALKVPLYIGINDVVGLTDTKYNCSELCDCSVVIETKPTEVCDGEVLSILDEPLQVIETPFHTKGSVCFYFSQSELLFSGDTLFRGCIGRSDLPSSIARQTKNSIEKLFLLPDTVKVFPGHGMQTSIGTERRLNPFIK